MNEQQYNYKKKLHIKQEKDCFFITGCLDKGLQVNKLIVKWRNTKNTLELKSPTPSNTFHFKLKLMNNEWFHRISKGYVDFFLDVSVEGNTELLEKIVEIHGESVADISNKRDRKFKVRLGEFEHTSLKGIQELHINHVPSLLYITKNNNISLAINKKYSVNPEGMIKEISFHKGVFSITGSLFTRNSEVEGATLMMIGRDSNQSLEFPVTYERTEETPERFGLQGYEYRGVIELEDNSISLFDDIYDVFLKLKLVNYDEHVSLRLNDPHYKDQAYLTGIGTHQYGENVFTVVPHITHGRYNLSFVVTKFGKGEYKYLNKLLRWNWLVRPFFHKELWLVGELPYKAQDTGFHFFKFMRENYPEREVYYVIDKNSPELGNVEKYGNVLFYKSKKHILYTLMATKIITSHHADYIYPLKAKVFKDRIRAKKVFLQHGVMGTRNSAHYYGKESTSFETDLFLVSSDFEKDMIVHDFGYTAEEVKVTGLSRFDELFHHNVPEKKQLLIIPTWREWLTREEKFLESQYFKTYKSLLKNVDLRHIAKKYKMQIVFCLHPNMQKYTKHLEKMEGVRIINQGEVDVQRLLKESTLMITDYSSVAFDFSFLGKPVLYYQFDQEKFLGERGSHLNLDKDLPGPIVNEEEELLKLLNSYGALYFQMNPIYEKRTKKFLKYKDRKNNQRILKAVEEL
ncbi:CDP-glycerol glycerophosphotransferase (TagB/SpsB family) [Evansella vedderi]|uniref:CDP-glycerol glycerophosphotransferase (TagB/SpsB family) n=1 Tax=Evansella vedderi TaxID=38282 RepID=A0ABT9ZUU7_9BACI|nr:CDP-glycerol glycerophosphotransferase family protein [Evansella vedderi]MDQ0254502.1 CDP-glycerol glycerophosphotransferase (TagB/SpsB family) [Evansella vedderi]